MSNFGRKDVLDVSTPDLEYEKKLFPLNTILDSSKTFMWMQGYVLILKDPADCEGMDGFSGQNY